MAPSTAPAREPHNLSPAVLRVYGDFRFHTDGDILALAFLADGSLRSVEEPGVLRHWKTENGRLLDWHFLSDLATLWAFGGEGKVVASASDDVCLWDAAEGGLLTAIAQPSWVTALAFGPQARGVATGHDDGTVRIWNAGGGRAPLDFSGPQRPISSLAFSPDGLHLAGAAEDKNVYLWDVRTCKLLGVLSGHTDRVSALAWHPQGQRLVSAGWDSTARVWDIATCEPVILLNSHATQLTALAFNVDGTLLVSADSENAVHVWDFAGGSKRSVLKGHTEAVHCLAISPDGERLASGGADKIIRLWDLRQGRPTIALPDWDRLSDVGGFRRTWTSLAVSADGSRLASTGGGASFQVWETASGQAVPCESPDGILNAVAHSPDRRWIAGGGADGRIRLWDAASGRVEAVFEDDDQKGPVTLLAFSPDSTLLASAASRDTAVWLWHVPSGEPALLIPDALDGCTVESLAFHPQGRMLAACGIDWLATGGSNGAIALWDLEKRCEQSYLDQGGTCLAFHPNGRWLATGSLDNSLCVWDLSSEQLVAELTGAEDTLTAVTFSPDGRWLAGAGDDRTLRLWGSEDWQLRAEADLDTQVKTLAFSPDGRFLYTGNGNTTCYQLDVQRLLAGQPS